MAIPIPEPPPPPERGQAPCPLTRARPAPLLSASATVSTGHPDQRRLGALLNPARWETRTRAGTIRYPGKQGGRARFPRPVESPVVADA